jgi:hypothetical protein
MSEDNYEVAKHQGLIGMAERQRRAIQKLTTGDLRTFYISKKSVDSPPNDPAHKVQEFRGIARVTGDAFESDALIWHVREGGDFPASAAGRIPRRWPRRGEAPHRQALVRDQHRVLGAAVPERVRRDLRRGLRHDSGGHGYAGAGGALSLEIMPGAAHRHAQARAAGARVVAAGGRL